MMLKWMANSILILNLAQLNFAWSTALAFKAGRRSWGAVDARRRSKTKGSGKWLHLNAPEPGLQGELRGGRKVVVLDFNNLRGKANFKASSTGFMLKLAAWARATNLTTAAAAVAVGPVVTNEKKSVAIGEAAITTNSTTTTTASSSSISSRHYQLEESRVVVVVDHGLSASAHAFEGMAVVFAGPDRTADDVIAATARWLCQDKGVDVLVSTSDRELAGRCFSANIDRAQKKKAKGCESRSQEGAESHSGNDDSKPQGSVQVVSSENVLGLVDFYQEQQATRYPHKILLNTDSAVDSASPNGEENATHSEVRDDGAYATEDEAAPTELISELVQCCLDHELSFRSLPGEVAALSSNSFREQSWHRVLSAEVLRRAMEKMDRLTLALAAMVGESTMLLSNDLVNVKVPIAGPSSDVNNDREQIQKTNWRGVVSEMVTLQNRNRKKEGERTQFWDEPPRKAKDMRLKLRRRVSTRGVNNPAEQPSSSARHPILSDHRLRHDPSQIMALQKFIAQVTPPSTPLATHQSTTAYAEEDKVKNEAANDECDANDRAILAPLSSGDAPVLSNGVHGTPPSSPPSPSPPSSLSKRGARRMRRRAPPSAALQLPARKKVIMPLATEEQIEMWLSV